MAVDSDQVRHTNESAAARAVESLRQQVLAQYGSGAEALRLAGGDVDRGLDRLAEELGVDVEQLLPVLVAVSLECEPRILERRWLGLGGFDWALLLAATGLLTLVLRAVLILL